MYMSLKDNLNTSITPGEDFYEYAVGGWLKTHPIPEEYGRYGAFEELIEENYLKLKEVLENPVALSDDSDRDLAEKIGKIYGQGIDEEVIEKEGTVVLKKHLDEIYSIASESELLTMVSDMHTKLVHPIFSFFSTPDSKNSKWSIGGIGQSGLGLPERGYYLEDENKDTREKYLQHVRKMFALAGTPDAGQEAQRVLLVETALATHSRKKEDLRDPIKNYNKMQRRQLVDLAPNFHWQKYFLLVGAEESVDIDVGQPEFIAGVNQLLKDQPLENWRAYLAWHFMLSTADYLPKAFAEEKFEFYGKVLNGQKKMKERYKRVIDMMDRLLGEAIGIFYVKKFFPHEAKERAKELVRNLLAVTGQRIEELAWMSPETKKQALKKLSGIKSKIGYPEKWIDYGRLEVGETFFESMLHARNFVWRREMEKIEKPVDFTEWFMSPQTINAYFEPLRNEIVFPAGILQPPFFDFTADDAVNYGGIGSVIGHEVTHAFDDSGRHFDENGELRDWWTKEDEDRFNKAAETLKSQYDSFEPLPGLHVNGKFTMGENIADLGGIAISYSALQKVLPSNQILIEGLTPVQRFFLSYAGTEKSNIRPEKLRLQIMVDPHSPSRYRVIGPLANVNEFYEAFSISAGDKIYRSPEERVVIW